MGAFLNSFRTITDPTPTLVQNGIENSNKITQLLADAKAAEEAAAAREAAKLRQKYNVAFDSNQDQKWYNNVFKKHEYDEKDLRWVLNDAVENKKLSKEGAELVANAYGMLWSPNQVGDMSTTVFDPDNESRNYQVFKTSGDKPKYFVVDAYGKAHNLEDYDELKDILVSIKDAEKTKASGGSGSGSGNNAGGARATDNSGFEKEIAALKAEIQELKTPKKYTADELAKLHNVEDLYNLENIKNMYYDATNDYWSNAIKDQEKFNRDALLANSLYSNDLVRRYQDGYKYAAPTSMGKGTQGAALLQTLIGAQQTNENTASNLNSLINKARENWSSDLASDDLLARQTYNDMGKILLQSGVNLHASDIKKYMNALDAYKEKYSGIRNDQSTVAASLADAYKYNADAALANNANKAANAADNTLKRLIQWYVDNGNTNPNVNWQAYYNNMNHHNAEKAGASSSAN